MFIYLKGVISLSVLLKCIIQMLMVIHYVLATTSLYRLKNVQRGTSVQCRHRKLRYKSMQYRGKADRVIIEVDK